MPKPCFYCGSDTGTFSEEHVISAALGCKEVLQVRVCKRCNDVFGHDLEGPFECRTGICDLHTEECGLCHEFFCLGCLYLHTQEPHAKHTLTVTTIKVKRSA